MASMASGAKRCSLSWVETGFEKKVGFNAGLLIYFAHFFPISNSENHGALITNAFVLSLRLRLSLV